jgi:hypothetical protein
MGTGIAAVGLFHVVIVAGAHAQAQWKVTNLHPRDLPSGTDSYGLATTDTQQVGYYVIAGPFSPVSTAVMWTGTAESYVILGEEDNSYANDTNGTQQVGAIAPHAVLWNGSADSVVELTPRGFLNSYAYGISGTQHVGWAAPTPGAQHACLWNGDAQSYVSLHPAGWDTSVAYGTSGTQQVGQAFLIRDLTVHASLWTGTAESWVDLHPADATASIAFATSGTQQVGYVYLPRSSQYHASLWSGTAESWVDLHPAGARGSGAYDIWMDYQVGYVDIDNVVRAALWKGTAESWIDLSTYLPPGFGQTFASGVWSEGSSIKVIGYGYNTIALRNHALLWTSISPADFRPGWRCRSCRSRGTAGAVGRV